MKAWMVLLVLLLLLAACAPKPHYEIYGGNVVSCWDEPYKLAILADDGTLHSYSSIGVVGYPCDAFRYPTPAPHGYGVFVRYSGGAEPYVSPGTITWFEMKRRP